MLSSYLVRFGDHFRFSCQRSSDVIKTVRVPACVRACVQAGGHVFKKNFEMLKYSDFIDSCQYASAFRYV